LGKLVARHRMATAAGAMVTLAVAIGAVVVFEQAQRAREEAEQAELVKQFAIDAFRASTQLDAEDGPGLPVSLERLLERSAPWAAGARTPRLQAELHGIVASLLLDAGSFEQAAGNARRQIGLLESLSAAPESRAAARLLLSRALLGAGHGSDAETEARRAMELAPPGSDLADRARQHLGRARDARQPVSPPSPAR
ncbi:MAG: hypothetical protein IV094_09550, partial [Vitreoscilla sp.]|nr:hypothetical protein [Vitreoscilla sp.]